VGVPHQKVQSAEQVVAGGDRALYPSQYGLMPNYKQQLLRGRCPKLPCYFTPYVGLWWRDMRAGGAAQDQFRSRFFVSRRVVCEGGLEKV
jgi:hypothetical protein